MSKMPALLLPDTAAPYAPRSSPTIVLDSTVQPWLTATLKRVNRIKRPLNSVPQHMKCLTETLSQASAIWNLCTLMVPRAPSSQLDKYENPLVDAFLRYELLQVQSYVVHVDMVMAKEVAFKLTKDTIEELMEYHKTVYLVDQSESTWQWTEKQAQMDKLQEEFEQAVNKFVFRTDAIALEGLEEDGAGELLCGRSDDVKNLILGLFLPLLPPPPRFIDIPGPTTMLPNSSGPPPNWWVPTPPANSQYQSLPPVEAWKVLPSSPVEDNPPASTSSTYPSMWGTMGLPDLPSVTLSMAMSTPYSQPSYSLPTTIPQLPLPSLMAQQCSTATTGAGFGFGWDRFTEYTTTI